jgi:hypothetical protein
LSVSAARIVAVYATAQPRLGAGPMFGGALLAPGRIVPKLVGALLSRGGLPLLLRGDGSVQKPVVLRHSVLSHESHGRIQRRTSCYADRPKWPRSQGARSADLAAAHAHHEFMGGLCVMKGA